jgi:hypothetical protein
MPVSAETKDVGADQAVLICTVPQAGVLVKNSGGIRVFLGGPGVTADGEAAGYPLDPGESQVFTAAAPHESPAVPAPADDMAPPQLYGRAADGTARVAWIAAG